MYVETFDTMHHYQGRYYVPDVLTWCINPFILLHDLRDGIISFVLMHQRAVFFKKTNYFNQYLIPLYLT